MSPPARRCREPGIYWAALPLAFRFGERRRALSMLFAKTAAAFGYPVPPAGAPTGGGARGLPGRRAARGARRLRGRLAEVEEALSRNRRAGREGRSLETARLVLLLDTLAEAAAGLRRELALPVAGLRPADTVDAAAPAVASAQRRPGDSASLDDLLTLPRCHLVVDGYNVTKGAWASMPLEAQRTRLVQRLGVLAARTGAEVTGVFDGADVSVPPPVTPAQGVRVLFSPQGQSADELIRRLVAAEPPGRAVIVVSSDREVADGVRSSGAWAVDSDLLVPLLG